MSSYYRTLIKPQAIGNPFTDATVAYSLRDLGLGATNVVKVRRSSDNVEQDFTASQIIQPASTSGSLLNFCGAGDGFVKIWYDQKRVYDATQTTASQQPKIVDAGSLILEGGKPSVKFDDNSLRAYTGMDSASDYSIYAVIGTSNIVEGSDQVHCGLGENFFYINTTFGSANNNIRLFKGDEIYTGSNLVNKGTNLINFTSESNNEKCFLNSVLDAQGTDNSDLTNTRFSIGNTDTSVVSRDFRDNISEIILFSNAENRTQIETNINNHYNIY